MPEYHFRCPKCSKNLIFLFTIGEYVKKKTFKCPECRVKMVRVFEPFSVTHDEDGRIEGCHDD